MDLLKYAGATIAIVIVAIVMIPAGWWLWDVHSDRQHTVDVEKTTPFFAPDPKDSCDAGKRAGILAPGEQFRVRRIRYYKECMVVTVNDGHGKDMYLVAGVGGFQVR
jgi:hypothetical protein